MSMNKYKSLILIGLFAVGFSSCQTDDLQKDIDALKERVEDFEMQVQRLNDEMNIIRVLLDGNKTISSYVQNGDKYTLTLSNGETIELTQGQDGKNYPSISIGSNGNWFINGNDTGNKAEAEDGKETEVTPQFKIIDGTWWVSYNGIDGKYENLGVPATGEASGVSPIYNFEAKENEFVFKLSETSEDTFSIPVVEGLTCQILGEKDYYDNIRAEQTFKVKVNLKAGDLVRAVVPSEWKAEVSDYSTLTGENELTLTVTPPTTASKCVLSVEVTRGVNTAADEVVLKTAISDYYSEYMAGFDINIGNVTINKFVHGEANLINSGEISTDGVYFVDNSEGADNKVNLKGGTYGKLIVIGKEKDKIYNINLDASIVVGSTSNTFGVALKGLKLESGNVRPFSMSKSETTGIKTDNLIVDNCDFSLGANTNMSYLYDQNWKTTLNNLYMCSSRIGVGINELDKNGAKKAVELWTCRAGIFSSATIMNNIIYCNVENKSAILNIIQTGKDSKDGVVIGEVILKSLRIENNTFVNILGNLGGSGSGMARTTMEQGFTMKNNLFWYNNEIEGNKYDKIEGIELKSHLMAGATFFDNVSFGNNLVYSAVSEGTKLTWQYFRTLPKNNVEAGFKNDITLETENPFTKETVPYTGTYTYTEAFKAKGIGADIQ